MHRWGKTFVPVRCGPNIQKIRKEMEVKLEKQRLDADEKMEKMQEARFEQQRQEMEKMREAASVKAEAQVRALAIEVAAEGQARLQQHNVQQLEQQWRILQIA